MSGEHRRIIVVEDDHKTNDGWAKVFGAIFIIVFVIALIDHNLTLASMAVSAWFN
jgi:hypothetical protein